MDIRLSPPSTAFINLGAMYNAVGVPPIAHCPTSALVPSLGLDVRIDPGGGVVVRPLRRLGAFDAF